jgi:hypothetical protein
MRSWGVDLAPGSSVVDLLGIPRLHTTQSYTGLQSACGL